MVAKAKKVEATPVEDSGQPESAAQETIIATNIHTNPIYLAAGRVDPGNTIEVTPNELAIYWQYLERF